MRLLIQRVKHSSVKVEGEVVGAISQGLLVLAGFEDADNQTDIDWGAEKVINLRIFDDENGVMNRSVMDIDGQILCVSQFTLHASTKKGNRPSYIKAAKGEVAKPMYENLCSVLEAKMGKKVERGIFGADMKVELLNDGPVTIWIDTKNRE